MLSDNTNLGKLDILISRLLTDIASGNLRTISTIHEKIHKGEVHIFSHIEESVANNSSLDIFLKSGAAYAHSIFNGNATGDSIIEIFEDSVISNDGTVIPIKNKNRNISETNIFTAFEGPTISDDGTSLIPVFLSGGSGGIRVGASSEERDEFVLKLNTNYIIRITNKSGVPATLSITGSIYEGNFQ